jgi:serine protease Do
MMSDVSQARIVVRHISGSKVNQVEQIPLKDLHEVSIGRDLSSTVAYDQKRDDIVSRRHAVIRVEGGDNPKFKLTDLGSSNGTFLNGERVSGEIELAPDDVIELGKGGPKFSFDVQPRPASMAARTRVIDALDTTVTRAIAAVSADGTREAAAFTGSKEATGPTVPPKVGVGKETVMRMLSQERKSTSRVWMGSIAAVIALLVVGGFGLYRYSAAVATHVTEVAQQTEQARQEDAQHVSQKMGLLAKDLHEKYQNTAVYIDVAWRLYDRKTGQPVYQKVIATQDGNFPAFVKLKNGEILRWLVEDSENRTNNPIGVAGASGSGFVVGEQGFILTNKHVGGGWNVAYRDIGDSVNDRGVIFDFGVLGSQATQKGKKDKKDANTGVQLVSLRSSAFSALRRWVPTTGAPVFKADNAAYIGDDDEAHVFIGRNELLEVRFPGNRMSMTATLVRASTDADAALIKIDAAQSLKAVELAKGEKVEVGDRVMVLGYPGVSDDTYAITTTNNDIGVGSMTKKELVPEPTLTEGIVSHLGAAMHREGDVMLVGEGGDLFQLSINSTGAGNSGGPVFNAQGKVIGLFVGHKSVGGATASFAVPIKYGLDLLEPQRAGAD